MKRIKGAADVILALALIYVLAPFLIVISALFYLIKKLIHARKKNSKKVLIFAAFPVENAGYHWRVKKLYDILKSEHYTLKIRTLWNLKQFNYYLENQSNSIRVFYIFKRACQLLKHNFNYDRILVRRQAVIFADLGWNILEILQLLLYSDRILDFDDDVASSKQEPLKISVVGRLLGMNSIPFSSKLKYYDKFIVGNEFLDGWLRGKLGVSTNKILILPTCYEVDYNLKKSYEFKNKCLIVGWLGSNGNHYVLDEIINALNMIHTNYQIELRVVSGKIYSNVNAQFKISNRVWTLDSEKREMLQFDIGIMPLTGRNHEYGKSGFKLIQYMAVGLVTVSSDIGMNKKIVENGINGYLYNDLNNGFKEAMMECINSQNRWESISKRAMDTISENYTLQSHKNDIAQFFN